MGPLSALMHEVATITISNTMYAWYNLYIAHLLVCGSICKKIAQDIVEPQSKRRRGGGRREGRGGGNGWGGQVSREATGDDLQEVQTLDS